MPVDCPPRPLSPSVRRAPTADEVERLVAHWRREMPHVQRVPWLVLSLDGSASVVYARTTPEGFVQFEGDAVRSGRPPEARWWEPVGTAGTLLRDLAAPTVGGWTVPVEPLAARCADLGADGAPRVAPARPRRWRVVDHDGRLWWFVAPWLVSSYAFVCDFAMDGWSTSARAWAAVLLAGALVIAALYLRRAE